MVQGCGYPTGGLEVRKKQKAQRRPSACPKKSECMKKCKKNPKGYHWGSNPGPSSHRRALLPLGWLYIRLYNQNNKYMTQNAPRIHFIFNLQPKDLYLLHFSTKMKSSNMKVVAFLPTNPTM